MADTKKRPSIGEKIRQALDKLGEILDDLLPKPHLQPQPIPVDRPYRRQAK